MNLAILGGTDLFQLFCWVLDQLGVDLSERVIRTALVIIALVMLALYLWCRLRRRDLPADDAAAQGGDQRSAPDGGQEPAAEASPPR